MQKSIKTGIIAFLSLMLLVVILAIISNKNETKAEPVVITPKTNDEAFKENFLSGCYDGSNYAYCSCAYDYMEKKIGVKGIMKAGLEYEKTNKMTEEMIDSAVACSDKL